MQRPSAAISAPRASSQRTAAPSLPETRTRRSLQRFMLHAADIDAGLAEQLWTNADALIASGRTLKEGDRCTVVQVAGAAANTFAPSGCTLKRYNLKGGFHTAVHALLRSRARWGWLNARRLIAAGLPTPVPLACIEELRHGALHLRSYLLTAFVPGRSLLDLVSSGDASGEKLADLAKQFSRMWQTLGQMRAGHGDMKATNFLVDPQWRLWLLDLDGLRIHRSGLLLRRERRNDLARFMRNWQDRPEVAAIFRARIGTG